MAEKNGEHVDGLFELVPLDSEKVEVQTGGKLLVLPQWNLDGMPVIVVNDVPSIGHFDFDQLKKQLWAKWDNEHGEGSRRAIILYDPDGVFKFFKLKKVKVTGEGADQGS